MNNERTASDKRTVKESVLDPVSRASEILFGLIMVLTFTCSLSAATAGRSDVREMLLGALGCNIAWGIIDAFFYLMGAAAERGRERMLVKKLNDTSTQESARALFKHVLPDSILGSLSPTSFAEMRAHLLKRAAAGRQPLLDGDDFKATAWVFWLVFLTTFPVSIPFLVMTETELALRISNAIALILLFSVGYSLGHYAGLRAWLWGLGVTIIGASLVSVTIALGG